MLTFPDFLSTFNLKIQPTSYINITQVLKKIKLITKWELIREMIFFQQSLA